MGVHIEGSAEEEDIAYEEEDEADGRKRIEGCNGTEQMFCLWAYQEGAFPMPLLCKW